jgi:hypothetical protein
VVYCCWPQELVILICDFVILSFLCDWVIYLLNKQGTNWGAFHLYSIINIKHLNFAMPSKNMFSIFVLWFCPAFCSPGIKIYVMYVIVSIRVCSCVMIYWLVIMLTFSYANELKYYWLTDRWQSSVPCHLVEMSWLSVIRMVTHGFQLCLHAPQVLTDKGSHFYWERKGFYAISSWKYCWSFLVCG